MSFCSSKGVNAPVFSVAIASYWTIFSQANFAIDDFAMKVSLLCTSIMVYLNKIWQLFLFLIKRLNAIQE
jgi:hypothetical protein